MQWVITVPAVWEDRSKAAMAEAMLRAGLSGAPSTADSKGTMSAHPLLIALEPEAASLHATSDFEAVRWSNYGSVSQRERIKSFSQRSSLLLIKRCSSDFVLAVAGADDGVPQPQECRHEARFSFA